MLTSYRQTSAIDTNIQRERERERQKERKGERGEEGEGGRER